MSINEVFPYVSLIVPILDERKYILVCLDSLLSQDYPSQKTEIIIADGLSTDGTREIVAEYQKQHPNLRMIDNPDKIVPTGLNITLRQARGEIIILISGHCEIAPDYVSKCVGYILSGKADGVGGPMQTIGETPLSETIAVAMSSPFGVGDSAFRTISGKTIYVDTVSFAAYTRKIIDKVGLYDEELIRDQDDEYNYRIREAGGKLLLAADVQSRYYSRGSLGKLWKQYFQYGYWKVRVLQKHPRQMRLRQFVPPVFTSVLLGSALLSLLFSRGWVLLVLVGGSYLLANLAASFVTASKKGWGHLPLLPATFAILHLSYGLGFLIGLVKFANRWGDKKGKVPNFKLYYD